LGGNINVQVRHTSCAAPVYFIYSRAILFQIFPSFAAQANPDRWFAPAQPPESPTGGGIFMGRFSRKNTTK
jgi:hypothetical protein